VSGGREKSHPVVAWVQTRLPVSGPGPTITLVVAPGATGEILLRMPSGAAIVAGGRILYLTFCGYASTDGRGAAHFLRDTAGSRSQIALDGRTAYVTRIVCDADRLVSVDPVAAGTPPALPLPTLRSCPVRRASPSRLSRTPSGRVNIGLRRPAGCRGTLRLVQQRRGGHERRIASMDHASRPGTFVVRPRIAAYARALAGCSGGLRVNAVLFPAADHRTVAATGTGLGAYASARGRAAVARAGRRSAHPRPGRVPKRVRPRHRSGSFGAAPSRRIVSLAIWPTTTPTPAFASSIPRRRSASTRRSASSRAGD